MSQKRLWTELGRTPPEFVLYGGTALALRLGHRRSVDFDFFCGAPFDPDHLRARVPYLDGAAVIVQAPNTLTCLVDRHGPVRVSFFGGLRINRIEDPETAVGSGVKVASLIDLAATKAELVQRRASAKDYLDLDAVTTSGGVALEDALAAAAAVHGPAFNPMPTLKALVYFDDGDLAAVPSEVRVRLADAVRTVNLDRLPTMQPKLGLQPEAGAH